MSWWQIIFGSYIFFTLVPAAAIAAISSYQDWQRDSETFRAPQPIPGYVFKGLMNYVGFVSAIGTILAMLGGVILLLFGFVLAAFR